MVRAGCKEQCQESSQENPQIGNCVSEAKGQRQEMWPGSNQTSEATKFYRESGTRNQRSRMRNKNQEPGFQDWYKHQYNKALTKCSTSVFIGRTHHMTGPHSPAVIIKEGMGTGHHVEYFTDTPLSLQAYLPLPSVFCVIWLRQSSAAQAKPGATHQSKSCRRSGKSVTEQSHGSKGALDLRGLPQEHQGCPGKGTVSAGGAFYTVSP
ncbi:Hypothetical predicted protein [Pelobates cultripes]|uniref:Uncharacterized protein n=1 Tax=Pelobates cultripes TaxID=61616 RepID=A0AAD1QZD1_PELCU|nr:Hypothetical predicted protein [Pelobates cultripes]